jgi:hypothetical protein
MITDLRALRVPVVAAHKLGAAVLVGVAALLFSTCNSVPLTAPTNATITLYANTTIVPLNGTAQITATVIQSGGTDGPLGTRSK